jgi:hypothetical protein
VSPVRYVLGFYIPEDDILHSQSCEKLKYNTLSGCVTYVYLGVALSDILKFTLCSVMTSR